MLAINGADIAVADVAGAFQLLLECPQLVLVRDDILNILSIENIRLALLGGCRGLCQWFLTCYQRNDYAM